MSLLQNKHIQLCTQNHSYYGPGAYTGEVSAVQLKDLGLKWTMVGHSERRSYFAESNDVKVSIKSAGARGENENGDRTRSQRASVRGGKLHGTQG